MVSVNDIALLVDGQTPVGVTVKGKTYIQMLVHNQFLKSADMGRTGVLVDVESVGVGVDDICLRSKGIENRLGDVPCGSVCTVKSDGDSPERILAQRDEVSDVAVSS